MPYQKKVDDYIEKAKPFARPILRHLRKLVHQACPQIEEKIKWGMPYFEYKGIVCHMAAFNQHCAFGFWKAALMKDAQMLIANNGKAMGHAGKIKSPEDMPPDREMIKRIKEAVQLNEAGQQGPSAKRNTINPEWPEVMQKLFFRDQKLERLFLNLPAAHQQEYVEWIKESKDQATGKLRLKQMRQWIREGRR